ncbi:MAG: hypothetical protein K6T90_12655 [Leptolyngbyaceae cyanobacterium HOT.MB2.61]|nr:hypothetical protein [Leptolyngbyaceae cyanobacterium HOT.MB2.61]
MGQGEYSGTPLVRVYQLAPGAVSGVDAAADCGLPGAGNRRRIPRRYGASDTVVILQPLVELSGMIVYLWWVPQRLLKTTAVPDNGSTINSDRYD